MINLISVHFLREVCHRPFSYQYFSRRSTAQRRSTIDANSNSFVLPTSFSFLIYRTNKLNVSCDGALSAIMIESLPSALKR